VALVFTRAADVVLVVEVVVVVVVVDRPVACERTEKGDGSSEPLGKRGHVDDALEKREPPNMVLVKVGCVPAGRRNAD